MSLYGIKRSNVIELDVSGKEWVSKKLKNEETHEEMEEATAILMDISQSMYKFEVIAVDYAVQPSDGIWEESVCLWRSAWPQ